MISADGVSTETIDDIEDAQQRVDRIKKQARVVREELLTILQDPEANPAVALFALDILLDCYRVSGQASALWWQLQWVEGDLREM
jgi:hypothetical protein